MKKNRNAGTLVLTAAAVLLLLSLTVRTAMAYFTTYAVAQGGYPIQLGFSETEIEEVVTDKKEIQIKNVGDYDCFVRLKALVGNEYKDQLRYSEEGSEGKWTPGADGYYYYSDVLKPGESSSTLTVSFVLPEDTENFDTFNVIIVQECTKVIYQTDGTPTADWDDVAEISHSEYQTKEGA